MVDRLANTPANSQRIANVENNFAAGEPLLIPGRVLVGEGVLTKICRKKPKPRQFFLFNDILVYGNIIIAKKKYNKQRIIPLEKVQIDSLPDEGVLQNGWQIKTPTKSFAVYAATATEKAEWIAHIKKCLNDLLTKTGKTPTKEHAAVWVPDDDASVCMNCLRSQFTLINRKHHCRKCGAVVCGPCSAKKFLISSMASKPLRVCDKCYDMLSNPKMEEEPNISESKIPNTVVNKAQDSSADDSDDEMSGSNVMKENIENMKFEEKPTFYNDKPEDMKNNEAIDNPQDIINPST